MARDKEDYEDLEKKFYEIESKERFKDNYLKHLVKKKSVENQKEISKKNEKVKLKNENLKQQNKSIKSDRKLKKTVGEKALRVVIIYLAVVFAILFFQGFSKPEYKHPLGRFNLDNPILVTISGTTAVAVIGLFGVMLRGLYIDKKK